MILGAAEEQEWTVCSGKFSGSGIKAGKFLRCPHHPLYSLKITQQKLSIKLHNVSYSILL